MTHTPLLPRRARGVEVDEIEPWDPAEVNALVGIAKKAEAIVAGIVVTMSDLMLPKHVFDDQAVQRQLIGELFAHGLPLTER